MAPTKVEQPKVIDKTVAEDTQEDLEELAKQVVLEELAKRAEEEAGAAKDAAQAAEEAPQNSGIIIEFIAPGHATLKMLRADGWVSPEQFLSAGIQLIISAMNILNAPFTEGVVRTTVRELLAQMQEAEQEAQVRKLLHGKRFS